MSFKQRNVMNIKHWIAVTIFLFSNALHAKQVNIEDNYPYEFARSLYVGKKRVFLKIDDSYQLVAHDITENHRTMGFVREKEDINTWKQYVNVVINVNTDKASSTRIKEVQDYIERTYDRVEILDNNVDRYNDGTQHASTSIAYTDENGEQIVTSVKYISDQSSLIGVQVSRKVASLSRDRKKAEKMVESVLTIK